MSRRNRLQSRKKSVRKVRRGGMDPEQIYTAVLKLQKCFEGYDKLLEDLNTRVQKLERERETGGYLKAKAFQRKLC